MFIHSELFAFSIQTALVDLFLQNISNWIIFLVIMTMIIHIPKIKSISKKYSDNKLINYIQKNDFIRSVIGGWYSILLGGILIYFSWTITSIIFEIFDQNLNNLNWVTLSETYTNLQITLEQQRWIIIIEQFLLYGGLAIVSLLVGSGFFLMLSCLNIIFRKMSYFLISLCIFVLFFMSVFGIYIETAKVILEKYPSEKLYNSDTQVTMNP